MLFLVAETSSCQLCNKRFFEGTCYHWNFSENDGLISCPSLPFEPLDDDMVFVHSSDLVDSTFLHHGQQVRFALNVKIEAESDRNRDNGEHMDSYGVPFRFSAKCVKEVCVYTGTKANTYLPRQCCHTGCSFPASPQPLPTSPQPSSTSPQSSPTSPSSSTSSTAGSTSSIIQPRHSYICRSFNGEFLGIAQGECVYFEKGSHGLLKVNGYERTLWFHAGELMSLTLKEGDLVIVNLFHKRSTREDSGGCKRCDVIGVRHVRRDRFREAERINNKILSIQEKSVLCETLSEIAKVEDEISELEKKQSAFLGNQPLRF